MGVNDMTYDVTPAELFDELKAEQLRSHEKDARIKELESALRECKFRMEIRDMSVAEIDYVLNNGGG
jgi:hypothetical protein